MDPAGLTADSHASFSIDTDRSSPMEGTMGRRGNEPLTVFVKCDTNGQVGSSSSSTASSAFPISTSKYDQVGEYVAHLCCILPEESDFSKFYKVTVTTK